MAIGRDPVRHWTTICISGTDQLPYRLRYRASPKSLHWDLAAGGDSLSRPFRMAIRRDMRRSARETFDLEACVPIADAERSGSPTVARRALPIAETCLTGTITYSYCICV